MVIRVLAGVVPMICGALIFSGAVPVGKWVFGDNVPSPVDAIRTMKAVNDFSAMEKQASMNADEMRARLSPELEGTLTPAQRAVYRQRLADHRRDAGSPTSGSDHDGSGWAPSGGWGR